jgi:hypothetical protein
VNISSVIWLVLALTACGRVHNGGDSPDATAPGRADAYPAHPHDASAPRRLDANAPRSPEASTTVVIRSDAGTAPDECVAPCLRELMRGCTAPRMHTCYRDDSSGALCDPVTGWALVPYDGGMAGSGLRLAHDGTACLVSASGGASPISGILYFGPAQGLTAVRLDSNEKPVTMCGLNAMSPLYPYARDAACTAWVTNPMNFECEEIVSGPCPPLVSTFR